MAKTKTAKLATEARIKWNKKYRKDMRKYVIEKLCQLLKTKNLYCKECDTYREVCNADIVVIKSAEPNTAKDMIMDLYVKNGQKYLNIRSYMMSFANEFYRQTIADFIDIKDKDLTSKCWKKCKTMYIYSDRMLLIPDQDLFFSCLQENPNYIRFHVFMNHKQVLDHIPEDITELFPNARNIHRHFILHVGDTNTGKTYEAMQDLIAAKSGAYFAPLRLLALEGQEKLLSAGVSCSMLTGEEEDIRPDSTHISCTMEMMDPDRYYDVTVIDEAQMIADDCRGYAWTNGILGCYSPVIHVCMSENALDLIVKLIESCNDSYEIKEHKRNTKLIFENSIFAFPNSVRENDALVVFSRRDVLSVAAELETAGWKPSVIYGSLPYSVRKEEMRRFLEHETNVVVATDAIGMGINLPIHRVVFLKNEKYDGKRMRELTPPEIKQIAGRAGRRGIFDEGYVNAAIGAKYLKKGLFLPYKPLEYAGVQIPKALFDLPMNLSEIITEWNGIKDDGIYQKVSNEYRLQMCKWLEYAYPEFSKQAMWQFLCINYDENSEFLREEWKNIVGKIGRGERIDSDFEIADFENMDLSGCEQYYKYLDLYFSFARMLGYEYKDFRLAIMKEKEKLSTQIMEKLKKEKRKNRKRCKRCGKPLSFYSPYGICEQCYSLFTDWY